jgi:hypothetical protein
MFTEYKKELRFVITIPKFKNPEIISLSNSNRPYTKVEDAPAIKSTY